MKNLTTINSLALDKLNNDEFAQFMKGVVNLATNATLEKLSVKEDVFNELKRNLELLTEASRQSRLSQETEKLISLDKQRSELLSFVVSSFSLERKNVITSRKEAATVLYKEFKNYKGVQTLPIRQKSQAIDALLKDLKKPQLEQYVNILGLQKSVTALEDLNQRYQKLLEGRAENQVNVLLVNVKKVRKETRELYYEVVRYAYAMNLINPSEESISFINLLNKLIEDTKNANKQRLAQSSSAKNGMKLEDKESINP